MDLQLCSHVCDGIFRRHFFFHSMISETSNSYHFLVTLLNWAKIPDLLGKMVLFSVFLLDLLNRTWNLPPAAEERNATGRDWVLDATNPVTSKGRGYFGPGFPDCDSEVFFWKGSIIKSPNRRPWNHFRPLSLQEFQTPCSRAWVKSP